MAGIAPKSCTKGRICHINKGSGNSYGHCYAPYFYGAAGAARCRENAARSLFLPYRFRVVSLPFFYGFPAVFDRSSKACKSPCKSPAETASKSRLDLQVFCGFIPIFDRSYRDFKIFYYCISAIFYWGYLSFFCVLCWSWCKFIVDGLIICE